MAQFCKRWFSTAYLIGSTVNVVAYLICHGVENAILA